jgi:predicted transcriptional regulator of viral defense system
MSRSLRQEIGREEFDYVTLMALLAHLVKPHDRITHMLRSGEIVRVKKGLYVFGEDHRLRPYSRELLANLIYGPSFVSLDSALSFHGLIPEGVRQVTSVTSGRARKFETPVGTFLYRPVPIRSFHFGMSSVEGGVGVRFLMASPERALADKIREDRMARIRTQLEAEQYLFENLRLNEEEFRKLDPDEFRGMAAALNSRKVGLCSALHRKMREKR